MAIDFIITHSLRIVALLLLTTTRTPQGENDILKT